MEAKPRRNYRCRFYGECLSIIALAGSTKPPCIGCPFEHDASGQADLEDDLPGCIALLLTILADERSLVVRRDTMLHGIRTHLITYLELIAGRRPSGLDKTVDGTVLDQESGRRGE